MKGLTESILDGLNSAELEDLVELKEIILRHFPKKLTGHSSYKEEYRGVLEKDYTIIGKIRRSEMDDFAQALDKDLKNTSYKLVTWLNPNRHSDRIFCCVVLKSSKIKLPNEWVWDYAADHPDVVFAMEVHDVHVSLMLKGEMKFMDI